MKAGGTCEFCESSLSTVPEPTGWGDLVWCARCGSGRLDRQWSAGELEALYQENYRQRKDGERFPFLVERAIALFHRGRARWVAKGVKSSGRLLDIGCGRGGMMAELAKMGWEVEGVEFNEGIDETDRGLRIHRGNFLELELKPPYSVIAAFHVMEHLEDFSAAMRRIEELIDGSGDLILEVPNAAALMHRLAGRTWFGRDLPRHIYQLTPIGLEMCLKRRGWRLVRVRHWSLEFGPYSAGQSLANWLLPTWHNALYEALQDPLRSFSCGSRAALQLPMVCVGAVSYLAVYPLLRSLRRAETVRMHFRKS